MSDVLLKHTDEGGDIEYRNGRAVMDDGIYSLVYLALFGGNELDDGTDATKSFQWWGNLSETDPTRTYRSRTQHAFRTVPMTPANLPVYERAVADDLGPLVQDGLLTFVRAEARIVAPKRISLVVVVEVDGRRYEYDFSPSAAASAAATEPSMAIASPAVFVPQASQWFWLRASDLADGAVSSWADQFAQWPIVFVQGTADDRPVKFAGGGINATPYVRFVRDSFSSGDSVDEVDSVQKGPAAAQPHLWLVARWHTRPSGGQPLEQILRITNSDVPSTEFGLFTDGTYVTLSFSTASETSQIRGPVVDTAWHLFELSYDGALLHLWIDGVLVDSVELAGAVDFSAAATSMFIGKAASSWYGNIDIGEILAMHAQPSETVRGVMHTYLNNVYGQRWGLT